MKRIVCPRDAVYLHREPRRRGGIDPVQHAGHPVAEAVHAPGNRLVEGVDGDVEPVEPRGAQRGRLPREEPTVRRERDIGHPDAVLDLADYRGQVGPEQRLPPRQAHLLDAGAHEDPHDPRELPAGHEPAVSQEPVVGPEHLPGHAVRAAEIAAVRHGNAQVAYRSAKGVADGCHVLGKKTPNRYFREEAFLCYP
jgi:hypothetical protein